MTIFETENEGWAYCTICRVTTVHREEGKTQGEGGTWRCTDCGHAAPRDEDEIS